VEELHRRPLDGNYKTCLTQAGLLMEGLGCQGRAALPRATIDGKFVVSRAGEAYDAQAKRRRRKFRLELISGGYALYLSNQEKHSERGDSC
jgi:hypothetical protein